MRQELKGSASVVKSKTAEIKERMEPDRQQIELDLAKATEELRGKQVQRSTIGKSMAQLRKNLKASDQLSVEEQTRQQQELDQLTRDAGRMDEEISSMKAHIRLLKIKLLLIRL
jgi:hypothetical protein